MYSNENFIIELLTENGTLTRDALDMAYQHRRNQESTLSTLLRIGKVTEQAVGQALANASGFDYVDLNQYPIDASVVKVAQAADCVRYQMLPVSFDGSSLTVAVADPMNMETLDSLQHVLSYPTHFICAAPSDINKCIADFFAGELSQEEAAHIGGTAIRVKTGQDSGPAGREDAPIIGMVNQILSDAFQQRASDKIGRAHV